MSKIETKAILCPLCRKKSSLDQSNLYRPFCSERCKLIDLGGWANEDYKIPTSDSNPEPDENSEGEE